MSFFSYKFTASISWMNPEVREWTTVPFDVAVSSTSPGGRTGAAMWEDNSNIFVFGGKDSNGGIISTSHTLDHNLFALLTSHLIDFRHDMWHYNSLEGWHPLSDTSGINTVNDNGGIQTAIPPSLYGAAYAYDRTSRKAYLIGGQTANGTVLNSIWVYDMEMQSWELSESHVLPCAFATAWISDKIYAVGGSATQYEDFIDKTNVIDTTSMLVEQVDTPARMGTFVWPNYLYGGKGADKLYDNGIFFSFRFRLM